MSRFITGGRASGKTTKALQELEAQGGGIFITQNPIEVRRIIRQHGLAGIQIIEITRHTHIAIDDSELVDVIEVRNGPPMRTQ